MIHKTFCLTSLFLISGLFAFTFSQETGLSGQRFRIEEFLRSAKVTNIIKDLETGRTEFWQVLLKNGSQEKKAVFKYVNRFRPHIIPDSFQYELAAYELNKLLGLDIVPPVVPRRIEGLEGSLQLYMENCIKEQERKGKDIAFPNDQCQIEMDNILVFEILVADQCRDIDDTLVDCKTWKIWRIDFSEAFSPVHELGKNCSIRCCSKSLFQALNDLDKKDVTKKLKPFLNHDEIEALFARKDLIIKKINDLVSKKGKEKVLR